ncbi:MAG: hypothetical protein DSY42_01745 [Aquifex sp.]|nr:MAG: hypothetical protein DSY42_01745 [Aquifex sp.]
MISLLSFLLFLTIISCAPKVCPDGNELLSKVIRKPPEKVKLYGYIKGGYLRVPFLIEKKGNEETIKVPQPGLVVSSSFFCWNSMCFDLPVSPMNIIYGYFPGNYKVVNCGGEVILRSEDGKEIILSKGKLKAFKYKRMKILYGEKSPEGYYKNLTIILGNMRIKIFVEGKLSWEI